jgi:hypothetical protein
MTDSYSAQKLIEANISNEYAAPGVTDTGTLSTLKLLAQMSEIAKGKDSIGLLAREETKYLEAAAMAITTNNGLKAKFGSGFQGVQTLADILKAQQSKLVFDATLADVLKKANDDGGAATKDQFDVQEILKKNNYIA